MVSPRALYPDSPIHLMKPTYATFARSLPALRAQETDPEVLKALRRGWCLGSGDFKREMLLRMESGLGEHHSGELHREVADAKAERIVAEELKRQGWQEQDLLTRPRSDPIKLELAARLRRETTLTVKAIAARVHLGTSKAANTKLHHYDQPPRCPWRGWPSD